MKYNQDLQNIFADLGEFSNVDRAPIRPSEYQGTVIQCPKITSTSSLG